MESNNKFSREDSFLNYCRNCLHNILLYADEKNLVTDCIKLKSEEELIELEKSDDAQQWLINNGYKAEMYYLYYKHLFFSLLVDFSNYYNTSIDRAFYGNINVAWSLLRKPFQETLAYLEWLYVDKDELLKLMIEEDNVEKYEIMGKGLREKRKNNIHKIQSPHESHPIDMYDFRYSYNQELTINGILQATNHLITTKPALKTSPSGLNFVFLNEETINNNLEFYFISVPYVMGYTMKLIMKMFGEIAKLNDYSIGMNEINLTLKNLNSMNILEKSNKFLDFEHIDIYCPRCGKKFNSYKMWIDFTCNQLECDCCSYKIDTDKFIFDFEETNYTKFDMEDSQNGQT